MVNGAQVRAARALLGISQDQLAARSGVARKTIALFEQGHSTPQPRTLKDLQDTLEDEGIEFLSDDEGRVGVVLRPQGGRLPQ